MVDPGVGVTVWHNCVRVHGIIVESGVGARYGHSPLLVSVG